MNASDRSLSPLSLDPTLAAGQTRKPRKPPLAARGVLRLLERLQIGRLDFHGPDGVWRHFGQDDNGPHAEVALHDWAVMGEVLKRGDIAFAEAWMRRAWDTPDLPALLKLLVANREIIARALHGSLLGRLPDRIRHLLRRNSRAGSRDNIHAHYDIGNAFYTLWLDPSMTYSSALFNGDPAQTLEQAQAAKYARVLDQLQLQPGARVLEIGCGWGGLAEVGAQRGLRMDGITLSAEQLAYARARLAQAAPPARLELCDYRDLDRIAPPDGYDGIASIEMFEAVGEAYWPGFFRTVARQLKPGARACIQTITIADDLFDDYRRGTDFIQRYIFPGGMLPSRRAFIAQAKAAGLEVVEELAFGADYAHTLALWRERFTAQLEAVKAQGFDDRFLRLWTFYLAYCEAGFSQGSTDVWQFTLRHARAR
ncbi:MAG: class I SAM-dependent methyltransferase [Betaproteobacteria bacterium]|jgi:cyclopropane-fatty-acyl-phospholipid synthase|uniref:SAM-dependent methyltransferase n=1 Tax=Thiomonas TaxID=32012 RepID=UPI000BCDBB15|nr:MULTISPECIES: cyclopropane-fatty-acyl-phospholipid synthase family protein [Thiomonas]MDE2174482.1 class I SAM-dependent methyltransferase [Betaproteobacteria bacterium]OZB72108.1 MAG: SAM-dependent methyltransferase [Thiomonas sp. 13-64-67]HML81259.1 cyclopropane-fatty-acyl-phospholipid synthase family protein [Thiomonas arsenitoxydans]